MQLSANQKNKADINILWSYEANKSALLDSLVSWMAMNNPPSMQHLRPILQGKYRLYFAGIAAFVSSVYLLYKVEAFEK